MKNAARAGLFAPFIFQHVMAARLELLGLKDEMNALRARSNAETEAPNPGVVLVCTHELAGKTVPMAELPPDMTD